MKQDAKHITDKACALIKALHNPPIGAKEFSGGWMPERCDAILFKSGASFMIETKISRSDFLADKKKSFRNNPNEGVGNYRYYACPDGLIKPEELPKKWGLIYVLEQKNRRALMPVGYGGSICNPRKDTKCPEHGWTLPGYDTFGSKKYNDAELIENFGEPDKSDKYWWYHHPEQPRNKHHFKCSQWLENQYLFSLATRYKKQQFMNNMI